MRWFIFNNPAFLSQWPDTDKQVWLPDSPDVAEMLDYLRKHLPERKTSFLLDPAFKKHLPEKPDPEFSWVPLPQKDALKPDPSGILLYAQSDTLAHSLVSMTASLDKEKLVFAVPRKSNEGERSYLESRNIPYQVISKKLLQTASPKLFVTLNDWTREVHRLLGLCRAYGIPSICIQESVIDFGDRRKRMQHADYAFIQGTQTLFELDRPLQFVTGNPRYESIQRSPHDQLKQVLINCNFTYNIYEHIRYRWLKDIKDRLEELDLPYAISQHPRDKGDLSSFSHVYPSAVSNIHEMIRECSLLITRFSSLIHEALIMGKPVIYYNPHGEEMRYDFGFEPPYLQLARDRDELKTAILNIRKHYRRATDARNYLIHHCMPHATVPSENIATLFNTFDFQAGRYTFKQRFNIFRYHPFFRDLIQGFRKGIKV